MKEIEFILYVANQEKSSYYYQQLLEIIPSLNVPGMTEFELTDGVKLGLMPEDGIAKIVTDKAPHPKLGNGIPRCELYLKIKNAAEYLKRGVLLGGKEISELKNRDWGDKVGYISDLDGHIIAFAESEK
ncbi:lactoylglutathione lyase [Flavobacterium sp.]|uniref:lactoylglutathione lyase n=1 Tax=Flavobacterium sp. TaxID=239 RepID=UPI002626CCDA|nr:lactoylglutathione lyase [Flavobacterium sp.]MDD2986079.1 lactoylglutathione lyase [Flavobacterium sp.]